MPCSWSEEKEWFLDIATLLSIENNVRCWLDLTNNDGSDISSKEVFN